MTGGVWWRAALVAIALVAPAAARANPFLSFGFEPRGIAMGGAMTAEAHGPTGVWYNPALLSRDGKVEVELGFSWARPSLDVSAADGGAVDHATPPDYGGYAVGLLFPLGGKVEERLSIGVGLYLPSQNLLRMELKEPTRPYWYQYDSSPDRIVVLPGAAWKFTDWLSVGVGTQVLAQFVGGADVEIDLFNQEIPRRELRNDLEIAQALTAGLYVRPIEHLHLGASWRGELQLDFSLPTNIVLTDLGTLGLELKGVAHYTPHIFAIGASYEWTQMALTFAGTLEYQLWSRAPSPALAIDLDLAGELPDSLGLGSSLDAKTQDASPGFGDVLVPRLGVEYRLGDRFWARGGYFYRPTYVPDQVGATSFLDGDAHGLSAGLGFSFDDPLDLFEEPLTIDLSYQRLVIVERTVDKIDGTTLAYGGFFNHVSAAVKHAF